MKDWFIAKVREDPWVASWEFHDLEGYCRDTKCVFIDKTNSSRQLDQTGLLGFRDFSLPLNVSPDISIRPISVYLQNQAKVACGSYGETRNLYFP